MKKKITISVLLIILIIVGVYNVYKPLPKGISMEGSIFEVPDSSVKFLYDLTYINSDSEYVSDQVIFDEVFSMIQNSENFILLDMFLFNDFMGSEDIVYKQISSDLVNELVNAKINNPELEILVLTDPLNTIYGAIESDNFNRLKEYDIMVVETNLRRLRDSNPVYSSLWRSFLRFLPLDFIKLPNPFDSNGQRVSIRAYFELLNFKANHRKLIIADYVDNIGELKVASLITSANPHDGSSRHSNVAVRIDDFVWRDILKSELATLAFSSEYKFEINKDLYQDNQGDVFVQLLTERQIKNSLIN